MTRRGRVRSLFFALVGALKQARSKGRAATGLGEALRVANSPHLSPYWPLAVRYAQGTVYEADEVFRVMLYHDFEMEKVVYDIRICTRLGQPLRPSFF